MSSYTVKDQICYKSSRVQTCLLLSHNMLRVLTLQQQLADIDRSVLTIDVNNRGINWYIQLCSYNECSQQRQSHSPLKVCKWGLTNCSRTSLSDLRYTGPESLQSSGLQPLSRVCATSV